MIRAILLASATATTLKGRLASGRNQTLGTRNERAKR